MENIDCVLLDRLDPLSAPQERESGLNRPLLDSATHKFTKESILLSLKYKRNEYTIIEKNSSASCWQEFGLPARILGPGKYEIIPKFASCKSCFQTYSYSSSTSTLSNHKCSMLSTKDQPKVKTIPMSQSTTSTDDQSHSNQPINAKTLEKHKRSITSAISDWICSNTRPINIVEDVGLRNLIDQCIKIGNFLVNIWAYFCHFFYLRLCLWTSVCLFSPRVSKNDIQGDQAICEEP